MLLCQLFEKAPKFSLLDKMPKKVKSWSKIVFTDRSTEILFLSTQFTFDHGLANNSSSLNIGI